MKTNKKSVVKLTTLFLFYICAIINKETYKKERINFMKKFLSLLLLLSLMQISTPVYADINDPTGSPADSDWSSNLYNPANSLSPNHPDNQNNSDDEEEYTHHGNKKQPSFLEVIFGIITAAAGFLGAMYYLIFYFVLHDKD